MKAGVNSMVVSLCQHMSMLLVLTGGLASIQVTGTTQGLTPILNSSGPAVVGSDMTFHAILYGCNETSVNLSQFIYIWTDNAHTSVKKLHSRGGCSSQITRQFSRNAPGLYTMTVCVCNATEWPVIWFVDLCFRANPSGLATTVFNLTDQLNGRIVLKQKDHVPHTYLTHVAVHFSVNITDQIRNATFTYTWRVNDSNPATMTYEPSYNHTFRTTGWYKVEVQVKMSTNDTRGATNERYGVFQENVQLKDAVSELSYFGKQSFPVGSFLHADVRWNGSAPFRLSWNLSSAGSVNCSQTIMIPQRTATLDIPLQSVGNYVLAIDVVNDWSTCRKQVAIMVSKPALSDSGTPVSLVLLCIVIGFIVVMATGIAYRRDRQVAHHHLEVADFNFHSHSTPNSSVAHCVAALRLKWRHLWISCVPQDVHTNSYDSL